MGFFGKSKKILGMNARNLLYLSRFNSRANKKFADDKIFTKNFLSSRGIGVAKLFAVVKNFRQLSAEFFENLPNSFVIKPNRGFGGAGILVISQKKNGNFFSPAGKIFDINFLYRHCGEILDGKFSISGISDSVIFEEKIDAHESFQKLTKTGLSDIRVIVFNLVPVLAMARIPTIESDGKANMELGAIAMGIDIGTGITTGAAQFSNFLTKMPSGISAANFQIPFWNEILSISAKIQQISKIGFLGCDLVATPTGVKILEINARAGLKIQVANRVPLKSRLEKIADLKILSPEEGVKVAKTLFSEKKSDKKNEQKIFEKKPAIGILEPIILNSEKPQNLVARVDLTAEKNKISPKFFSENEKILDITIAKKRLKLPTEIGKISGADVILAGKFLTDFYIDPAKKIAKNLQNLTADLDEKMIKNVDEKICAIDEKIKLLSLVNPQNLDEQKNLFFGHPDFSPQFFYREPKFDFAEIRAEIKKIPRNVDHFLMPLFEKKILEIENKILLLENIDSENFSEISQQIFGKISEKNYRDAARFLKKNSQISNDDSEIFSQKEAAKILENFLHEKKLLHWKIKILENAVVDIQITKKNLILLKKGATFQKNRLKALLAHEIGTHIFRLENGRQQNLKIFARGTAGYLRTEEGLAIFRQNQLNLNLGEKFLTPALQIVAIFLAAKMGFRDLFYFLKNTYEISNNLAWKLCVKTKRGFRSAEKLGAFTKDAVYFLGNAEIEKFVKNGGEIEKLFVGKISIADLPILEKIKNLQPAKFF